MKLAATLLALSAAAPAVACDYPAPAALGVAPHLDCSGLAALAATSVQTYSAPVVQLAPVVQSYQSAVVALPTVTHSYAASGFAASYGHNVAFGSGHNVAFSGHGHNIAFSRGFVAGRHNVGVRNRAFNQGFNAGRRAGVARRREGIVTRALRLPGRVLGGLFGR